MSCDRCKENSTWFRYRYTIEIYSLLMLQSFILRPPCLLKTAKFGPKACKVQLLHTMDARLRAIQHNILKVQWLDLKVGPRYLVYIICLIFLPRHIHMIYAHSLLFSQDDRMNWMKFIMYKQHKNRIVGRRIFFPLTVLMVPAVSEWIGLFNVAS